MKKLFAWLFFLTAGAALSQPLPVVIPMNQIAVPLDGGPAIAVVDFTTPQAEGTSLMGPCPGSGSGAPSFRLPCASDFQINNQAAFPGTAQTGNAHVTGTIGADTRFELASGGTIGGTALGKLTFPSTDGRAAFSKNTPDNSFRLWMGCVTAAATCMALDASATGPTMRPLQADGAAGEFAVDGFDNLGALKNNAGSPYTLTLKESQINCDTSGGAVTLNLPATPNKGHVYRIVKSSDDTTACTITPNGADRIGSINGSVVLTNRSDYLWLYDRSTGGLHWEVIGGNVWNQWGGTAAGISTAGANTYITPNNAQYIIGQNSENLTLSTSGLTTDTAGNLLPAGAMIDQVVVRITTTITTTTNWAVGDGTQSARFCSANATKTSGTTSVCMNHLDPTVATANLGPVQAAAAKVRITCTGSNPGAGAIRITVFYRQAVAPAS